SLSQLFKKLLRPIAETAGAQAIPDDNEGHRNGKDQGRNGVDFRGDAEAKASPDFERQSIVAADKEKSHGDFVHRKREDEARGGETEPCPGSPPDPARALQANLASAIAPRCRRRPSNY